MSNLIKFFRQIKRLIGKRIYILFIMVSVVGVIEGLGITLFLPILQSGFGNDKLSRALKSAFRIFHLNYSFSLMLALIMAIFILRSAFLIIYTRYCTNLSAKLIISLRRKVVEDIFRADYLHILQKEIGYVANIITREIACVVEAVETFIFMFNYSIYTVVYVTLSLILNFQLTFIVVLLSPILFVIMRRMNFIVNKLSRDATYSYGRFHSILIQSLGKIKYLKSTFSNPRVSKIIDKENRKTGFLRYDIVFLNTMAKEAFEPIIVLVVVSLLFVHVVIFGKEVNEVIFLSFLFLQIARQFMNAQSGYRRFISSIGSIETLNNFEKELEENKEDLHPDGRPPDFNREILFKDVTVVFPNGKKALDGLDVSIKPRSITAFVGHSGSGKSTIANMIAGIIRPTGGEMFFGDVNYNRLNLELLRMGIGYVTQEDIVFNASIRDNISLWDEKTDEQTLKKVIEMAHMGDFIQGVPGRDSAFVGGNGLDISGGQRQRITIARELYKDAPLLILDEATSSLDAKYERAIYENLKEFRGEKTMVVIAHRLSTIKNANYIYVMDDGKVVEEGTFEELSADKNTKFYHICQLQTI